MRRRPQPDSGQSDWGGKEELQAAGSRSAGGAQVINAQASVLGTGGCESWLIAGSRAVDDVNPKQGVPGF